MKQITPVNGLSKDVDSLLSGIHRNIGRQSFRGLYFEGWKELQRHNSKCTMTVYKVLFVTGGIFAATFVLGSTTFGCLALAEAVEEYEHSGKAPIIGHFSEWTMQALLAAVFSLRGPYEIARLGYIPKIEILFQEKIGNSSLSRQDKEHLYKEKMRALLRQVQNNLIAYPRLPNPGVVEKSKRQDLLEIDFQLQDVYTQIEKELNVSGVQLIRMGWQEVQSSKSSAYITTLKTATAFSTVFLLGQFTIYSMGITWSADQAVTDYQDGANPSIGGHCLEWFAEMLGVGNAVFTLVSELANIGSLKLTVEVFKKHLKEIEKEDVSGKRRKRLKEVLAEQIDKIPQGYVFSLPTHLQF